MNSNGEQKQSSLFIFLRLFFSFNFGMCWIRKLISFVILPFAKWIQHLCARRSCPAEGYLLLCEIHGFRGKGNEWMEFIGLRSLEVLRRSDFKPSVLCLGEALWTCQTKLLLGSLQFQILSVFNHFNPPRSSKNCRWWVCLGCGIPSSKAIQSTLSTMIICSKPFFPLIVRTKNHSFGSKTVKILVEPSNLT